MSIRLFCSYLRTRVEENSSMSLSDAVDSFADDDGTVDTSSHGPLESSDDAAMTSLEKYLLTRPTMTCVKPLFCPLRFWQPLTLISL